MIERPVDLGRAKVLSRVTCRSISRSSSEFGRQLVCDRHHTNLTTRGKPALRVLSEGFANTYGGVLRTSPCGGGGNRTRVLRALGGSSPSAADGILSGPASPSAAAQDSSQLKFPGVTS